MFVKLLLIFNKLFKLPVHPFNLENEGKKSYSMWQYEKGNETLKCYEKYSNKDEMFKNKNVLDVGCGAGGKSLYYLSLGAKTVTGIDVISRYKKEAYSLKEKLNLKSFKYIIVSAENTKFKNDYFETIIVNDAMEHFSNPGKVLNELYRILKPGGKLYINFPPYNHPYGAHLSDAIGIPWVHILFSDKTLIKSYKKLVINKPDGNKRITFRISKDENGKEYFSYINKMSIRKFNKLLSNTKFVKLYYNKIPLRKIMFPLSKIPILNEFFVKMVVVVLTK